MDKIFKALGEQTRLKIFLLIEAEPNICLCDIEKNIPLSSSNLSRHLKELENVELIKSNKLGKWKHYTISLIGEKILLAIHKLEIP